ncbi:hypothetical protein BS17DRAFT_776958 [Gyrodon lividus]|nr:hypothetical protein BS17DRAFT_776958 [Gyrodon lividus]
MPHPTTHSRPIAWDSSPPPDNADLFNLVADTSADFEGLSFPDVASPRLLLRLPPCQSDGVPPLVSVLEHLASCGTPANANVPPQSAHDIYHHTIFAQASKGLDLNVPYVVSHLWKVLAEVIPDVDFSDLLEAPILNLPDPNARLLLPGFQLATNSSSVVRLVPVQPEVLNGHKLALPARVVNVMKANWNVHIPLTTLSTRSLTSLTLSAREESGQALSVKDGVISLSSSRLSAKDEGFLTSQEWLHAFPHLIDLNPSIWQEVVWRQTIDTYRTGTQHLLPGMTGITPPMPKTSSHLPPPCSCHYLPLIPPFPTHTPRPHPLVHRPPLANPFHRLPGPPPPYNAPFVASFAVETLAESVLVATLPLASYPSSVVSGKHLRVSKFASGGMAVAAQNLLAHDATSAPTAGACTLLKSAISNRFFPIVTPFLWWKWEELLRDAGALEEFLDVLKGICFGWKLGVPDSYSLFLYS